jgi:hypothetical protein
VGPRAGLDNVEKRKFLTVPGLELRPRSQSLSRHIYILTRDLQNTNHSTAALYAFYEFPSRGSSLLDGHVIFNRVVSMLLIYVVISMQENRSLHTHRKNVAVICIWLVES